MSVPGINQNSMQNSTNPLMSDWTNQLLTSTVDRHQLRNAQTPNIHGFPKMTFQTSEHIPSIFTLEDHLCKYITVAKLLWNCSKVCVWDIWHWTTCATLQCLHCPDDNSEGQNIPLTLTLCCGDINRFTSRYVNDRSYCMVTGRLCNNMHI